MERKLKHPYLRLRKKMPPPGKIYKDKKKEASKKACRCPASLYFSLKQKKVVL